ncbi:MAG TPA: hypothetical protein PK801_04125 [Aggregatilineales bacterium]|nr:pyroglutamyl-peptidase I [Chloroflexota bacterium]HOA22509.1 hypothetical protein [Aggregatilineales bacterium]HPV07298.1 hypothetical protein [Aggregatilineales bacterium]HQA67487.1 hypothetical protein [Aggregatilineales bacterium]HQE17229.1 hypothetical protein [Aggregatilineales bacterium]
MTDGRRTALITAFEPFGGREKNAAEEALRRLAGQVGETFPLRLEQRVLPVEADAAAQQLCAAIDEVQPAYVVCLGEATRGEICLERIGYNERRYPMPDNAGRQFDGDPIREDGPESYTATLPLDAMLEAMQATGVPVRLSDDAGRYLCNEALYTCLDHIAQRGLPVRAGFIHVPRVPGPDSPDGGSLPTEDVVRALIAGLTALAEC